jgi:predicted component of type VI protein secretion system
MNVRLVLERKRKRIWTTQLRRPEATIGRALGSTIRIPSSEVSRLHCRLRIENGVVTVEDLESINGTFLNGVRVRDTQTVRPGDRLTIGPATLVVEYELTPDVLKRLGGQDDYAVLEADDEIEIVGGASAEQPVVKAAPVVEPVDTPDDGEDMLVFDGEAAIQLPEGNDLRDFLIELDDTGDQPKKPPKKR